MAAPDERVVFDRMAARYDELRPSDAAWWEQFERTGTAGLAAATRLLDVGCGTGRLANAAADRFGLRAWGVDRSEAMVEQARAQAGKRVAFRVAPADALPFRDGWFDAVTMRVAVPPLRERRATARRGGARAAPCASPRPTHCRSATAGSTRSRCGSSSTPSATAGRTPCAR